MAIEELMGDGMAVDLWLTSLNDEINETLARDGKSDVSDLLTQRYSILKRFAKQKSTNAYRQGVHDERLRQQEERASAKEAPAVVDGDVRALAAKFNIKCTSRGVAEHYDLMSFARVLSGNGTFNSVLSSLGEMLECFDDGVGQDWNAATLDKARIAYAYADAKNGIAPMPVVHQECARKAGAGLTAGTVVHMVCFAGIDPSENGKWREATEKVYLGFPEQYRRIFYTGDAARKENP